MKLTSVDGSFTLDWETKDERIKKIWMQTIEKMFKKGFDQPLVVFGCDNTCSFFPLSFSEEEKDIAFMHAACFIQATEAEWYIFGCEAWFTTYEANETYIRPSQHKAKKECICIIYVNRNGTIEQAIFEVMNDGISKKYMQIPGSAFKGRLTEFFKIKFDDETLKTAKELYDNNRQRFGQ